MWKMKPYWKKKWVEALRSGEYKQCRNELHNGRGFCCLGVLADISTEFDWEYGEDILGIKEWSALTQTSSLPKETSVITGLFDVGAIGRLVDMNDGFPKRHTFNQIADWIEENL